MRRLAAALGAATVATLVLATGTALAGSGGSTGIAAPSCCLRHQEPYQEAEGGREQHEPEVSRMMLPLDVQAGNAEEQEEARQRNGEDHRGQAGTPHSTARSSRS